MSFQPLAPENKFLSGKQMRLVRFPGQPLDIGGNSRHGCGRKDSLEGHLFSPVKIHVALFFFHLGRDLLTILIEHRHRIFFTPVLIPQLKLTGENALDWPGMGIVGQDRILALACLFLSGKQGKVSSSLHPVGDLRTVGENAQSLLFHALNRASRENVVELGEHQGFLRIGKLLRRIGHHTDQNRLGGHFFRFRKEAFQSPVVLLRPNLGGIAAHSPWI